MGFWKEQSGCWLVCLALRGFHPVSLWVLVDSFWSVDSLDSSPLAPTRNLSLAMELQLPDCHTEMRMCGPVCGEKALLEL